LSKPFDKLRANGSQETYTMRADQLLVERGLASSRSQAVRLIDAGARWHDGREWRTLRKSDELRDDARIELANTDEAKYVSRGGLKLEGALKHCALSVQGALALDVGQSTGGFTDCLLAHGAAHVVGVDVGYAQLHENLRSDPRVTCLERINARQPESAELIAEGVVPVLEAALFDVMVGDLSFVSQTLVWPQVLPLLKSGGAMLMLVKPQFELQPEHIGKGGIVKDAAFYPMVEQRIREAAKAQGLQVLDYFASSIEGGDGNREFFVHARKT
jgi:23S rRNA (cytidine1920-2'-O)/16S rRNA (cytidine1409-2'-O)-methyltransferase